PNSCLGTSPYPIAVIGRGKIPQCSGLLLRCHVLSFRSEAREASGSETPRVHNVARWCGGVAARGARAAAAGQEDAARRHLARHPATLAEWAGFLAAHAGAG